MVWIIDAICMILFGAGLVAIGLSPPLFGYAIVGGISVLAGNFCWCPFVSTSVRFVHPQLKQR